MPAAHAPLFDKCQRYTPLFSRLVLAKNPASYQEARRDRVTYTACCSSSNGLLLHAALPALLASNRALVRIAIRLGIVQHCGGPVLAATNPGHSRSRIATGHESALHTRPSVPFRRNLLATRLQSSWSRRLIRRRLIRPPRSS